MNDWIIAILIVLIVSGIAYAESGGKGGASYGNDGFN